MSVSDTRAQIPSVVERTRPLKAGAGVVAAHFLGRIAVFVLGEEALVAERLRTSDVMTLYVRWGDWVGMLVREGLRQRVHAGPASLRLAAAAATASVATGQMVQLSATPKDASGNPVSGIAVRITCPGALLGR